MFKQMSEKFTHPDTKDPGKVCDRDRHQWTGYVVSRRDGTRVLTSRTCSKCDAIGDPLELDL